MQHQVLEGVSKMVTVLPAFNRGASIGQAIGQGLQGVVPMAQQQYQRGQLQSGLDEALAGMSPEMQQQLGPSIKLLRAGGGIPGLERPLSTLLPEVLAKSRSDRVLGNEQQGPSFGQQTAIGNQQTPQLSESPFGATNTQLKPVAPLGGQQAGLSGVLPRVYDLEEMKQDALNYAQLTRSPEALPERFAQLERENRIAEDKRQLAEKFATDQGVSKEDLPDFMQFGQRHANIKDLPTWAKETQRDFGEWKNVTNQLETAFIPGFFTGLLSKKNREKTLDRLNEPVKKLVDLGKENQVRSKLASEYLSPTEIEGRINPLPKSAEKAIETLPKGTFPKDQTTRTYEKGFPEDYKTFKSYDEVIEKSPKALETQNNRLAKWLTENVTPETSLLVLRDRIINDRDYDWRQYSEALKMARDRGLNLTASQNNELSTVNTQAPQDSLSDIFTDWGRAMQYLRGNK